MLFSLFSNLVEIFSFLNVFKYLTVRTGLSMFTSMTVVFLVGGPLINYFSSHQIHDPIREDGPSEHIIKKIGTPTMGGLMILLGIFSGVLLWGDFSNPYNWFLLYIAGSFGLLGAFDDYKKIKAIVKNKRLFSLNLDPMAAAMNDINRIDGYHSMYPLTYKIKFRKIIENELRENLTAKNYYDRWGSRVYAFTRESKEYFINFDEAKKVGADYVLSKNVINNNKVLLVCDDCSNYFKLYKIK